MSEVNEFAQQSRDKAAAAALSMRESARMVKVFEPSQSDIDDAKRVAWNRTIAKIKEIYGLDSSTLHPNTNMDKYDITSGDYISGPAYIGTREFALGSRINIDEDANSGIDFGEDTIVPYLYPKGQYGAPASEVYTALAEALEEYSETGNIHPNALGAPKSVPDSLYEDEKPKHLNKRSLLSRIIRILDGPQ